MLLCCRNNENLARLSCKIISPLVFAHVRAAYPGMPVSEQNCHPFQWGRYIWMHNGVVGGFSKIKRRLLDQLSDAAYNSIQSFHSDSAVSFAVFLNHLPDLVQHQQPNVLLNAMQVRGGGLWGYSDSAWAILVWCGGAADSKLHGSSRYHRKGCEDSMA